MTTQKMTIHRALAELKLIDSKIEKSINDINPTGLIQKDKLVNNLYEKSKFEDDAKSKYQSISDLISRKIKIKSAIVNVNAITQVEISGNKMTIADAITYKSIIQFKKDLIATLTKRHNSVISKYNVENEKIEQTALHNAQIVLGKQDDKNKLSDSDVKNIVEPYLERNKYTLVDPLDVEKLTSILQNEVDSFEMEVDSVLSEINAITHIEI